MGNEILELIDIEISRQPKRAKKKKDRERQYVDAKKEPTPFVTYDTPKNIIESIRLNSLYNDKLKLNYELADYIEAKKAEEQAELKRKQILQSIVELAKENNACKFVSSDGTIGAFAKDGSFRLRFPEVKESDKT